MNKIIHLTAAAEPVAMHSEDMTEARVFGVQLALEVANAQEDPAEAVLDTFLNMLPDVEIMLASWDGTDLTCQKLKRSFKPDEKVRPDILNWLKVSKKQYCRLGKREDCKPSDLISFPFFSTPERKTADMRNARAIDLLRSTWRWPAPVAQNAGLVSAVYAPLAAADGQEFLIIVPKDTPAEDVTGTAALINGQRDDENILYKLALKIDGADYEYEVLTQNLLHEEMELSLPDHFEKTGVFAVPEMSDEMYRLLNRIEQRGPSLLWASTVLGERALEAEEGTDHPFMNGDIYVGARFDWLVQASTVSMFDIALSGLLLPVSNTLCKVGRRGAVLERLTRIVAAEFEEKDFDLDVDESKLYSNLHKALWEWVKEPKNIQQVWDRIKSVLPQKDLLSVIDDVMSGKPTDDIREKEEWAHNLTQLSQELGKLAMLLESEEGGEAWIIKVFEEVLSPNKDIEVYQRGNIFAQKDVHQRINNAFQAFLTDLRGDFDAPAALRSDFGAELVLLVTKSYATLENPKKPSEALIKAIRTSNPLAKRFDDNADKAFLDELWSSTFMSGGLAPPENNKLPLFIKNALINNLKILTKNPDAQGSFQPDEKPQPLWLPIARNPDFFAGEEATEHMSGLGFLISQGGVPVHLNLIGVKENRDKQHGEQDGDIVLSGADADPTCDPFIPLPAPGLAGLAIGYTGSPLSSPSLVSPGVGGQGASDAAMQEMISLMAPFRKAEATYTDGGNSSVDMRLPDLAYGKAYDHSCFWIPPSGVLPLDLRGNGPFDPTPPTEKDSPFFPKAPAWMCQRRVAIATTGVSVDTGTEDRENLHPISRDDPRVVVEGGGLRHRDIFRGVGGVGVLGKDDCTIILREVTLPEGFNLDELEIEARLSTVKEKEQSFGSPTVKRDGQMLTITTETKDLGEKTFWLRLRLAADVTTALSFADPQNEKGQSDADRQSHIILLAPQDPKEPKEKWLIDNKRLVTLDMPRVSFEVLERWAANQALWQEACGGNFEVVFATLREARVLFETIGHPYAEQLKALPDPAVRGLLLGLSHSDHTTVKPYDHTMNAHTHVMLAPYRGLTIPDEIEILREVLRESGDEDDKSKELKTLAGLYVKVIKEILEAAKCQVQLAVGDLDLPEPVERPKASIPKGTAAHLRVSPMVKDELFAEDGAFYHRMTELSVGIHRLDGIEYLLFDGPLLAVEAMIAPEDNKTEILRDVLTVHATGRARGYRIEATPKAALRQFSQCELITQRWRFEGRPIYQSLNPGAGAPNGPVVALGPTNAAYGVPVAYDAEGNYEDVVDFEKDIFSQRDDTDGDFKRIRLRPAVEKTDLGRFDWPERSATYYRHRIELISRYAGAMPRGMRDRDTPCSKDPWTARIAILAEPDAAPLVRPQFRTFLPLQQRMPNAKGPTPIACVLSEPPFSQLGLADRIDAELVTKNLFEVNAGTKTLKVRDIRKEISPDPLLSYFPVADAPARAATVIAEGPVGLHFDQEEAQDPAWSNSQYMLHIDFPQKSHEDTTLLWNEMEESFLGISLSRRGDPGWCWFNRSVADVHSDIRIELTGEEFDLVTGSGEDSVKHVSIIPSTDGYCISVLKGAIYKNGGLGLKDFADVWDGPVNELLLKSLGDNRYRLSIFRKSDADAGKGLIGGAQLNGSVVITAQATGGLKVVINGIEDMSTVVPASQSEATLMEWARSTRDFAVLSNSGEAISVKDLYPRLHSDSGRIHFHSTTPIDTQRGDHVRITAPLTQRKYPLHVHRRLAFIVHTPSDQIGREVGLYHDALLADDWGMAYMGGNRNNRPNRLSMSVAEVECRAEILLINVEKPPTVPEALFSGKAGLGPKYLTAHFDIKSTRPVDGPSINSVRFHIRAVNTPLDLSTLSVNVSPQLNDENKVDLTGDKAGQCKALELVLYPDPAADDKKTIVAWRARNENGVLLTGEDETPFKSTAIDMSFSSLVRESETLNLKLSDTSTCEQWVDVSMLHSTRTFDAGDMDSFDFDWLFGAEDLSTLKLKTALDMDKLNALPEVQARLIGLTDSREIL
jgi:hypothetical protein